MKWLLILMIYQAPADAVDWDGPWTLGMANVVEEVYDTEASCRNTAIQLIARMHDGMLAPMRFRCVRVEDTLPVGAPR